MPLVTHSTGANVPDVNELLPLVDDIPPVRRRATAPAESRTTCTPQGLRLTAASPGVGGAGRDPHLARCWTKHGSGLGVYRWWRVDLVVAAQLSQAPLRTDREGPDHDAFLIRFSSHMYVVPMTRSLF